MSDYKQSTGFGPDYSQGDTDEPEHKTWAWLAVLLVLHVALWVGVLVYLGRVMA